MQNIYIKSLDKDLSAKSIWPEGTKIIAEYKGHFLSMYGYPSIPAFENHYYYSVVGEDIVMSKDIHKLTTAIKEYVEEKANSKQVRDTNTQATEKVQKD